MQPKFTIPFSRLRYVMYAGSLILIVAVWAITFFKGGFNLGIDFKAGLEQTIQFSGTSATIDQVRTALQGSQYSFSVRSVGQEDNSTFVIRASAPNNQDQVANLQELISKACLSALEKQFGEGNVSVLQSDFIGPSLSNELIWQTFSFSLAAVLIILLYIWIRFRFSYAMAAIITLIHDPIFIVGFIGTIQMEVTTATIACVLTIIGYSLNDTIVVFDRIRENIRLNKSNNMYQMIDMSVTQTLDRTLVSSLTVILSMIAVYVFTTGTIHDFAFALIIGVIVGTYSSIFVAAPLMVLFSGGTPPKEKEKKVVLPEGAQA